MADVTVIIPAFAASATLRTALDSVLAQSIDAAIIVVLDGPDPAAEAILAGYDAVQVIRLPVRGGAPAARNAGLAAALSDYVMFLDGDDYLEGPLLASAVRAARATNGDLTFGPFAFQAPDGIRRGGEQPYLGDGARWDGVLRDWLAGRFTPPCAVLWRSAFVRSIGGWDERIQKNQDGDIIYRALFRQPVVAATREGLGVYVQHDNPNRISGQHGRAQLSSQLEVLNRVRDQSDLKTCGWRHELGAAYALLARFAFDGGQPDIGDDALAKAEALQPRQEVRGYYINLDEAKDRRRSIEDELEKLWQAERHQRFAAIDGTQLPPRDGLDAPGELGRFQSHLAVIRSGASFGGWLHVMEDGLSVSRFAAQAIEAILKIDDFNRYDILFTNVMFQVPIGHFAALRSMFDKTVEMAPSGEVTAVKTVMAVSLADVDFLETTSYLVNPAATKRVADLLSKALKTTPFEPVDVVFSRLARQRKLSMACTLPFLTIPRLVDNPLKSGAADPWRGPQRVVETAFYADRNVADLRAALDGMGSGGASSPTSDLIAAAYRQMLNTA